MKRWGCEENGGEREEDDSGWEEKEEGRGCRETSNRGSSVNCKESEKVGVNSNLR